MFNLQKNLDEYATGSELDFIVEPNGDTDDIRLEGEKPNNKRIANLNSDVNHELYKAKALYNFEALTKDQYTSELVSLLHFTRHVDGVESIGEKVKFFLKKIDIDEEDIKKIEKEIQEKLSKKVLKIPAIKNALIEEAAKQTQNIVEEMNKLIQYKANNTYLIAYITKLKSEFENLVKTSNVPSDFINIAKAPIDAQISKGCKYIITNSPTAKDLAFVGKYAPELLN